MFSLSQGYVLLYDKGGSEHVTAKMYTQMRSPEHQRADT